MTDKTPQELTARNIKGNKRVIKGWIFYDWANSVYNLVISSAIFPIFYANITEKFYLEQTGRAGGKLLDGEPVLVNFFGWEVSNSVIFSYTLSASFLMVALLSPLLSGIADYTGNKKRFMQFFCYLGALSCISLYWFNPAHIELGLLSIFLASIGFWNSFVFYNAYLPEIAHPKDHDNISARGFAMGYFGSMILLLLCLSIILFIDAKYTAVSFILVGLWWMGFAQITFNRLPNNVHKRKPKKEFIYKGFKELKKVYQIFRYTNRLKKYLRAFFFFNTGVQTVMLMAVVFAKKEINWEGNGGDTGLIIAILLIQLLGAGGAYLMSFVSSKIGNIKTLSIVVAGWILICAFAYIITTPTEFYFLAASVGLVMGGVQALARSTYAKFLPKTQDTASFFSFYDVTEKIGIVLGTFFFGLMELLTGDLRYSVLSIASFFVFGLILLLLVPKQEKITVDNDFVDN
ncbi:MAG: MFS transporter [Crocinitomicaceae bacterium]|nr:MFS transporter [Crocinitomicaceae bacterium]